MAVDDVPIRDAAATLGPAQRGEPVHEAAQPIAVTAWIYTRNGHQRVDGHADAWTSRAVHVRYVDRHGR